MQRELELLQAEARMLEARRDFFALQRSVALPGQAQCKENMKREKERASVEKRKRLAAEARRDQLHQILRDQMTLSRVMQACTQSSSPLMHYVRLLFDLYGEVG